MLEVLTFVFSSFWTFAWTPVRITHVHKHERRRDDPPVT